MRLNKAQISYFLILGFILIFVIGIGFYFVGSLKGQKAKEASEKVQQINLEAQPIKIYVDECLKDASIRAAYNLGLQGGYLILPLDSYDSAYATLPYYYKKKDLIPSREFLESELVASIEMELENCIDFGVFEQQGFNISVGEAKAKVSILNETSIINLDFPLFVGKDKSLQDISKFSYEIPVRLGHIHKISEQLIEKIVKEPYYIDLTFLLSHDLDISIIHAENCNDLYVIYDNYSKTPEIPNYLYLFAAKIDDEYCKFEIANISDEGYTIASVENNLPSLSSIEYATAYINQTFEYNTTAFDLDNDKLFYLDDTDLFQIHPLLGAIQFIPKTGQEGLHKINITVVDINGGYDSKWFYLDVK